MSSGMVYLVGAGPGDPGLLTLRGAEVLRQADLVLYDGLANPLLLRLTNGVCERTARTRIGSDRIVPQSEINDRLIEEARAGKTVVRLKGGDPYIFGRGSEEAAALAEQGIPFEVVPGITAATAAGEYAGFSFTHRDISSAVAFVTGHEDPSRKESRLDYAALASFPGTLVFYMGLGQLVTICEKLVANGKPADTPAAVICRASLPGQQSVTSTLHNLATDVQAAQLKPPSLIVVGECITQRDTVSWFEQRPLFGQTIGVTRPDHQCDSTAEKIIALSGQPVLMPLIEINPLGESEQTQADQIIEQLNEFDWLIFTSVNGVQSFFDRLSYRGKDARSLGHLQLAAIGASTEHALQQRSLKADLVPDSFHAEALATELASQVNGKRVLWVRANRGREVLTQQLTEAGAVVTECAFYRNEDVAEFDPAVLDLLKNNKLNWVGLSSPSIARQFARLIETLDPDIRQLPGIVTISPVTSEAARTAGLTVTEEATTHTWDGILDCIARHRD